VVYILHAEADDTAQGKKCLTERTKGGNMKLNSALEKLLVMGVKASGSYDPKDALGTVEEHMTLQEIATATSFLNWIVVRKLTFGRGNIRERFRQFETGH
jgi:hypothetical protein